jgi:hypothetical protein
VVGVITRVAPVNCTAIASTRKEKRMKVVTKIVAMLFKDIERAYTSQE